MSTQTSSRVAITGPGLKKQGVVVLQTLFIALFTLLELWIRSGVGIVTGLVLCIAVFGGIRFGRSGTRYVSVVTPPLAFATTILVSVILALVRSTDGLCISARRQNRVHLANPPYKY